MNRIPSPIRKGWMAFLWLTLTVNLSAQNNRLYVDDFTSDVTAPNWVLRTIRLALIEGLEQTQRVELIDGVQAGSDLRLSALEDARRFQADYLLKGRLLQYQATNRHASTSSASPHGTDYQEAFTLQLDLQRTADGVTVSTRQWEGSGSATGQKATPQQALEQALEPISAEMNLYAQTHFKPYGSILRLASASRQRAKTVYINLGHADSVKEGLRLEVLEPGKVQQPSAKTPLGEITIDKVLGPNISLGKVKKGHEAIFQALEAGRTLQVTPTLKP